MVIGLGSMIGAGVFVAFAPAARAAGTWLLVGLAVAATVAYANATASAQLASQYPTSGGTYVYGREQLGPWWGFVAGWGFVIGKTASCAAMALAFGAYVAPPGWERAAAVVAVLALAATSYRGVTRTARLTRIVVTVVLLALTVAVVTSLAGTTPTWSNLTLGDEAPGAYGVLQAAGLLFFAFAGYARIATLGEEVREPGRTIPRAIQLALGITVALYAVVAATLLAVLGSEGLADQVDPVAAAVESGTYAWASPVVRLGGAAATLGALLALMAGIGRTTLAMARAGDLPRWLAAVHPRYRVPHRAEVVLAGVVCVIVLTVDLRGAIGFSSFGVLVYYLVANLAAARQRSPYRRFPRALQALGAAGCTALALTLPLTSVLAGVGVLACGALLRGARGRGRRP